MAKKKGKTMSEVLRDALALEKFAIDVEDKGGKLLYEDKEGKPHVLVNI